MSLSINSVTSAADVGTAAKANPSLLRLAPKDWLDKVRAYAQLVVTKRETAAAAKAADDAHKAARAEILRAMSGAPAAACGNYTLGFSEKAGAEAAITTVDGRKIKWSAVTSIMVGNETIKAADIGTIYGGRGGSIELSVHGGV